MGFKCVYSAGYTPLAQAVVEKLNAVIVSNLRALVSTKPKRWAEFLPSATYGYNVTPIQANNLLTPYLLQYGRYPHNVGNIAWDPYWQQAEDMSSHVKLQHDNIRETHNSMRSILLDRQTYDRDIHMKHQKFPSLEIGALVFVKTPPRAASGDSDRRVKLQPAYVGPMMVTDVHRNNTVELCNVKTGKYLDKAVHLTRIKHLAKLSPQLFFAILNNEAFQSPLDEFQSLMRGQRNLGLSESFSDKV